MKRPRIPQSRDRRRDAEDDPSGTGDGAGSDDAADVVVLRDERTARSEGAAGWTAPRSEGGPTRAPGERREQGAEGTPQVDDADVDAEDAEDAEEETLAFPEPKVVGVRRRRRRGLWLLGGGLLALLLTVVVLTVSPLLTIRTVEVQGNDLLTDDRAQELLEPVVGRPLPQVGNRHVEDLLAEEPVIDQVVVQGRLPDELLVEVVEHPPVAEVRSDDEIRFYNEDGQVIRTFDAEDEEQVAQAEEHHTPVIGEQSALQDRAVFRAVASVLGELPPSAREAMDSASASSVDSVELELTDGRTVLWGSSERGREKAAVLEALLDSEDPAFAEADTVDISTPDAPVTR
ncbi:MAG: FtsQ-type POTRA domain-containing protein [Nesterenkonia sp.]|nr:FtsQ-type POTRA domain-containing protein [Nesterenkonia sp.]